MRNGPVEWMNIDFEMVNSISIVVVHPRVWIHDMGKWTSGSTLTVTFGGVVTFSSIITQALARDIPKIFLSYHSIS